MKHCSTHYFLLLVAVLTTVVSCKKTSPPEPRVQFPLSVKATAIVSQEPVRLFTHEGEVTDATVIAQFIAGADGFDSDFEIEAEDVIIFHTDSTAEFKPFFGGTVNVRTAPSNQLTFYYQWVPDPWDRPDPLTEQFTLDHYRIAKTNVMTTIPSSAGYQHTGDIIAIASGTYQTFELPATVYLLSRWRGQGEFATSYYSSSGVFSPFNENFLKTLGARDTVAYQENVTRFSK